jgi:Domain of unknown function (DUF4192)
VIGLTGGVVTFGARHDLPPPPPDELAATMARQPMQELVVVGYGPPVSVTTAVLPLIAALRSQGLYVQDALRVAEGRWWSYLCTEPLCCPPEGRPCRPPESAVAADAVFRGMVALPNRRALVEQVAAAGGEVRAAMVTATARAQSRMADLLAEDLAAGRSGGRVRKAGREAVRDAERRYRNGATLTDDEFAWLGIVLVDSVVRDYSLDRSDEAEWRIRLWNEVVRRVEPAFVVAPACLLGYAAWRAGDGSLARVAIDRALKEDPADRIAALLDDVLCSAISPDMLPVHAPRPPQRPGGERRVRRRTRRRSL